jgi:hypothetical protein
MSLPYWLAFLCFYNKGPKCPFLFYFLRLEHSELVFKVHKSAGTFSVESSMIISTFLTNSFYFFIISMIYTSLYFCPIT